MDLLDDHYRTDFALAHLLQGADLVVGATDPVKEVHALPVRVVVALLNHSKAGILRVAGAISELDGKTPVAFDPIVNGCVPYRLYIRSASLVRLTVGGGWVRLG